MATVEQQYEAVTVAKEYLEDHLQQAGFTVAGAPLEQVSITLKFHIGGTPYYARRDVPPELILDENEAPDFLRFVCESLAAELGKALFVVGYANDATAGRIVERM